MQLSPIFSCVPARNGPAERRTAVATFCNEIAWNLEEQLAAWARPWGAGVLKDKRIEKNSTSWSLTLQCSALLNEKSWELFYWVLSHHQILLIISCLVSNAIAAILMWLALQGIRFFSLQGFATTFDET
jgi:hypothetical protein